MRYLGIVMALNLLWRFAWAFFGGRYARWRAIVPAGAGYLVAREQFAKHNMRAVDQGDTDQERLTLIAIKFFDSRVQAD
jgi:hypothetical protein